MRPLVDADHKLFANRTAAGKELAEKLAPFVVPGALVLGLPRGGVPIGYEIATRYGLPLDTLVARKIGTPYNTELSVGALAPGGVVIVNDAALYALRLRRSEIGPIVEKESMEMEARIERYHSGEYSADMDPSLIIIADDGLATGMTARAAVESVRRKYGKTKIIFAAPICSRQSCMLLRAIADEVMVTCEVQHLGAIGYWYHDFTQLTDEEVIGYLRKANRASQLRQQR
ncbi:MAG: phosphoribosyltransferase family protein [Patescibacteria group bacterium]